MVRANLLAIIIACIPLIVVHTIFITQYQEALVQGSQEPDFSNFGPGFFNYNIPFVPASCSDGGGSYSPYLPCS